MIRDWRLVRRAGSKLLARFSEVCRVESLRQFLSRSARSGRTKPQAHARVSEERMRGRMELQESERRKGFVEAGL